MMSDARTSLFLDGTALSARRTAITQAVKGEGWTRRKAMVRGGEYPVSDVERTVTVSADGRFQIYPSGSMRRVKRTSRLRMSNDQLDRLVKSHGFYGHVYRGWRWSGYRLMDLHTESPSYPFLCRQESVKGIKEAIARWRLTQAAAELGRI
jgi:hypothetical protein